MSDEDTKHLSRASVEECMVHMVKPGTHQSLEAADVIVRGKVADQDVGMGLEVNCLILRRDGVHRESGSWLQSRCKKFRLKERKKMWPKSKWTQTG
jgi:hypothetical protein